MKRLLRNLRRTEKWNLTFSIIVFALCLCFMIATFRYEELASDMIRKTIGVIVLLMALASGLVLTLTYICCLRVRNLLEEWDRSNGVHHWTELPKGVIMGVTSRADWGEKTILGLQAEWRYGIPVGLWGWSGWCVQFDVDLPPEVVYAEPFKEIIILDLEEDLLHTHFERGVIILLTRNLGRLDDGVTRGVDRPGAQSVTVQPKLA